MSKTSDSFPGKLGLCSPAACLNNIDKALTPSLSEASLIVPTHIPFQLIP